MKTLLAFARPFTLIAPMLGVISGALTALGSQHSLRPGFGLTEFFLIAIAALAAGILNAAGNGINQIYDLEIDRINKPERPLAGRKMSMRRAAVFTLITYFIGVGMTWIIVPFPQFDSWTDRLTAPLLYHECIVFYLLAALFTLVYSVPALGRTKRMTFGAHLTIAIPRGLMLKVAGWSVLASVWHWEPWYIGLIFFLFLIGAAGTKDFSDMEGDRQGGCNTLPVRFGVRKAAWMIAPSFVLPWLLIPLGLVIKPDGKTPILTGDPLLLVLFCLSLVIWGSYTLYLILRNPEDLSRVENHPSWKHMYLMMFWAQTGFAAAYLIRL
ncbi:MAG: UbiA family prenyltransferase [Acidobacteriota bacterium]|nr:UbiA family prenyltransferase [Acidobacteriota bacterium]